MKYCFFISFTGVTRFLEERGRTRQFGMMAVGSISPPKTGLDDAAAVCAKPPLSSVALLLSPSKFWALYIREFGFGKF